MRIKKKTCFRCGTDVQDLEWLGKPVCDSCYKYYTVDQKSIPYTPYGRSEKFHYPNSCKDCAYASQTTSRVQKENLTNLIGVFTGTGPIEYNYVDNWACSKFKFDVTSRLNLADSCTSYITQADYEEKCLSGEMDKEKANVQIILDFSSLKDVMAKGGLVMLTYKCPNCNGMVKLPEAGKVLICEYCGTPIKPIDIFEKIKSLIQ